MVDEALRRSCHNAEYRTLAVVWVNVNLARIYVLTVVPLKIALFWGLTPYSLVALCQCFGVAEFFQEPSSGGGRPHGVTSRKITFSRTLLNSRLKFSFFSSSMALQLR
jgi:hypothetical protein